MPPDPFTPSAGITLAVQARTRRKLAAPRRSLRAGKGSVQERVRALKASVKPGAVAFTAACPTHVDVDAVWVAKRQGGATTMRVRCSVCGDGS